MRKFKKIVLYTIADIMNHRSVYVALAFCILFVLLLRGCFHGPIMINGQEMDPAVIAEHLSRVAFHLIAGGALMIACLLSMRLLGRDREDGTAVMMLSRPVRRAEYLAGRVAGLWGVSCLFMLLLQLTVVLLSVFRAGGALPGYVPASLLCCLNLLFITVFVCLLSLLLPEFLAAAVAFLVITVSFISESAFHVMQSDLLKAALGNEVEVEVTVSLWRSLFPKVAGLQYYASSLLGNEPYQSMGPVSPVLNIALYTALLAGVLLWRFRHEEL
jgi:ABC-type transport system involved in multi-copper enzyme maturation permease subunit